jgi:hypothetical protein
MLGAGRATQKQVPHVGPRSNEGYSFSVDLSRLISGFSCRTGVQKRIVDFNFSVVADESELAEFVHEKTDTGSGGARSDGAPVEGVSLYKIDHFCRRMVSWPLELTCGSGRSVSERRAFKLKSRMPQSEYTMNIFYIIGVIVVILIIAGFLGLR